MKKIDRNKRIILDADVIIHFYRGEQIALLPYIYSNTYIIIKDVLDEVFKGKLRIVVENYLKMNLVSEIDFSSDLRVLKEYALLKKKYGLGESACMAYCKFNNDVLASSNLKDIRQYCEKNNIQYLTTMDFINTAYEKGMISEADCDYFIYNVISKGSRLPFNTMADFRKANF